MSRKVIIPPGVLDPNQVNIIQVPKSLENSNVPLLVTPARKGLRATALPMWNDELSYSHSDYRHQHYGVREPLCTTQKYAKSSRGESPIRKTPESPPRAMTGVSGSTHYSNISSTTPPSLMMDVYSTSSYNSNNNIMSTTPPSEMMGVSGRTRYSGISAESSSPIMGISGSSHYSKLSTTPPSEMMGVSGASPYSKLSTSQPSAMMGTSSRYSKLSTSRPSEMMGVSGSSRYSKLSTSQPSEMVDVSGVSSESQQENYDEVMCANENSKRKVTYVSTKSSRQVDDNAPEGQSVEVEAPEGIDEYTLKNVLDKNNEAWNNSQEYYQYQNYEQSQFGDYSNPSNEQGNYYETYEDDYVEYQQPNSRSNPTYEKNQVPCDYEC